MPHEGLDDRLLDAVERLAQGRRAYLQAIATRRELTPLQIDVLLAVATPRGGSSVAGQVARRLDVAPSTVADAAAALRRKGLLVERPDPDDRRRRLLTLSAAGAAIAGEIVAERQVAREALDGIAAADKAAALDTMLTLIAHLHEQGIIAVDRSCKTCRLRARRPEGDWCTLLGQPLRPAQLRVDCPEHDALAGSSR